jgi:outer membrane protein OmpA-like peptidoglycan-associated protein
MMKRTSLIAGAAVLVCTVALAQPAMAGGGSLKPLQGRTSDGVVAADLGRIAALGESLDRGPQEDRWRVALAKGLLTAARTEYLEDDRTGFPAAAFQQAERLAGEVASGAEAPSQANLPQPLAIGGTARGQAELWQRLQALKEGAGFRCAAGELAMAEAALLWAANEAVDCGECWVSPHLDEARRQLEAAESLVAECTRPAPEPEPVPEPVVEAPVPVVPTVEELHLPRNVHFGLDQHQLGERSREVIAGVVQVMLKYEGLSVRLEGHTDSRASARYNLQLSQKRVDAVRAEMIARGIAPERISFVFKGKSALKVEETSAANFARNRRVEMVFVDAEGHDLQVEDQEEDLQLEQ